MKVFAVTLSKKVSTQFGTIISENFEMQNRPHEFYSELFSRVHENNSTQICKFPPGWVFQVS